MRNIFSKIFVLLFMVPTAYSAILDQHDHILPEVISIFRSYKPLLSSSNKIPVARLNAILNDTEPTLEELNILAQENFLRPAKSERIDDEAAEFYEKMNKHLTDDQKNQVINDFKAIGDIGTRQPKQKTYDWILIMGSTVQKMRPRVMYASDLYEQGFLTNNGHTTFVFLTGDRKLFKSETQQVLLDPAPYKINQQWTAPQQLPTDEGQAALWIYNQLQLSQLMRDVPVIFINSDKRPDQNRAQTSDTVKAWAKKYLQDVDSQQVKSCLIISSNPFIDYQVETTRATLLEMGIKTDINLEGVGPSENPEQYPKNLALGILLDNLARAIYTQVKISNLK